MKYLQATRDFAANAWLAAAPLILLVLLPIVVFICLFAAEKVIARVWSEEAADNFLANAMTLLGAALLLAPIGLLLYGLFSMARWLLRSKKP
jgi:hypothetical protein